MNKKLLKALQKRLKGRLSELRSQLEAGDIAEDAIDGVTAEIEELSNELTETEQALADLEEDPGNDDPENRSADNPDEEDEEDEEEDKEKTDPEKRSGISQSAQTAIAAIGNALSTRNAKTTKKRESEIRSAFANFVVGNISESEARSLGIEVGNGSVTVPVQIAKEVIAYAQEENLLRKYGSYVETDADVKYPVLVKKAEANVNKKERSTEIEETDIEFDSIDLDPAEFDALATITKKLLKRSGVNIEQIVIDELKKAYVRKETNYMFNGNDVGNENPGALAKKAVAFYESETVDLEAAGLANKLYSQLVKMKGQVTTAVRKKSMWIVNGAAVTALEGLLDANGRPLLYETPDGLGYKLLGHNLDFTDAADGTDPAKPVFYFGDFKAFHIQEIKGGMELQKLVEKYAGTNKIGFQIYNLIDGQLIYSPFEPAVYRYEVGAIKPGS
ncbi:phage major capsid protein [Lysinibacillus boronitolerans]|uniref:phage major capsid protein n=1 Tax=Lysinibacillus boronitolerans TaxID=309788 RepID=UPI002161F6D6|nr:phage major capsid protein [Lysinibacillus boronitolerans]MCS1392982.1 phage major capsid protein [Lysinibacillus boronitolerans]